MEMKTSDLNCVKYIKNENQKSVTKEDEIKKEVENLFWETYL